MNISIQTLGDVVVVTIEGIVDSRAAGPLYDALVAQVRAGTRNIVVELSGSVVLKRAGIRGLIVAAKLLQGRRGQMRICAAQPQIEAFLKSASFGHLLTFDRDRAASISAITPSCEASVDDNHLPNSAKVCRTVPSRVRAKPIGAAFSRAPTLFPSTDRPSFSANCSHAPKLAPSGA
ncbi:anti-anti-sigma factor [Jannaschia faecimaris]|uniref:Anti-anti-sigma factor n=1 Tax=Jannaschia faecimaris TaxID=1244108 RepID=A0A1H3SF78_9RHOB|nr:STAS domain-containing protein [Jannaschia faecimaris]SDZ36201.1 anti-anti-sigma factor [Jannaschia faecimaris]